jgi:hypothetical protein
MRNALPGIDPKTGIVPGSHNPHMGPAIRFEPGAPTLDPGHVLPNMAAPSRRGIWFPIGFEG